MTVSAAAPSGPGHLALWFGVLAPPAAWFLHLVVSYSLVRYVCRTGSYWTLYLTTAGTAALAVAATLVAWRAHRELRRKRSSGDSPGHGRAAFLALSGIAMGLAFLGAIALQAIPNFILDPCV